PAWASILISSVLFGVYHLNIVQAAYPFGIFFADDGNASDAVSPSSAVAQINGELADHLTQLQENGTYDRVEIQGQPPTWSDVLAVFAAKTAGAEDGMDVAVLDPERVEILRTVFWDMTKITSSAETVEHPANGNTEAWTEEVLAITITPRTPDDMRVFYSFTEEQNEALDELLASSDMLMALAGDLTISSQDAKELLANLPTDLSPERRAVVETACRLVGKVNYFWGGKSLVLGWDDRWGTFRQVTAAGSSTTGTYRPYGMDCSGYVDWVFYNITGGGYIIGHGGGAHTQHTYCTPISWEEAMPGDLVFYPGDEHVGIVGGRDGNGNLLIIHCAYSANNVVITGAEGFTSIGRPVFYSE
ncbi:MAG: C40 family peptidase, partial [Oscillospiraceae bacterium]|nr:C40 family peptidase [Oscillospiraceae bacterium]